MITAEARPFSASPPHAEPSTASRGRVPPGNEASSAPTGAPPNPFTSPSLCIRTLPESELDSRPSSGLTPTPPQAGHPVVSPRVRTLSSRAFSVRAFGNAPSTTMAPAPAPAHVSPMLAETLSAPVHNVLRGAPWGTASATPAPAEGAFPRGCSAEQVMLERDVCISAAASVLPPSAASAADAAAMPLQAPAPTDDDPWSALRAHCMAAYGNGPDDGNDGYVDGWHDDSSASPPLTTLRRHPSLARRNLARSFDAATAAAEQASPPQLQRPHSATGPSSPGEVLPVRGRPSHSAGHTVPSAAAAPMGASPPSSHPPLLRSRSASATAMHLFQHHHHVFAAAAAEVVAATAAAEPASRRSGGGVPIGALPTLSVADGGDSCSVASGSYASSAGRSSIGGSSASVNASGASFTLSSSSCSSTSLGHPAAACSPSAGSATSPATPPSGRPPLAKSRSRRRFSASAAEAGGGGAADAPEPYVTEAAAASGGGAAAAAAGGISILDLANQLSVRRRRLSADGLSRHASKYAGGGGAAAAETAVAAASRASDSGGSTGGGAQDAAAEAHAVAGGGASPVGHRAPLISALTYERAPWMQPGGTAPTVAASPAAPASAPATASSQPRSRPPVSPPPAAAAPAAPAPAIALDAMRGYKSFRVPPASYSPPVVPPAAHATGALPSGGAAATMAPPTAASPPPRLSSSASLRLMRTEPSFLERLVSTSSRSLCGSGGATAAPAWSRSRSSRHSSSGGGGGGGGFVWREGSCSVDGSGREDGLPWYEEPDAEAEAEADGGGGGGVFTRFRAASAAAAESSSSSSSAAAFLGTRRSCRQLLPRGPNGLPLAWSVIAEGCEQGAGGKDDEGEGEGEPGGGGGACVVARSGSRRGHAERGEVSEGEEEEEEGFGFGLRLADLNQTC